MHSRRRAVLSALAIGIGGTLAAAPLVALPAAASVDGTGVVISEVYLKGGSSGAVYSSKFVELYNPGDDAQDLAGWSLQYRSATGSAAANGVGALSGSIAAGGHYLVKIAGNGAVGAELPAADVDLASAINPSGTNGTLYLSSGAAAVTPTDASVVDRLGYGTSNAPEGTAAPVTGANSVPNGLTRDADGTDTDDNAADFAEVAGAALTPEGTGSDDPDDPDDPTDPTDPTDPVTIAEIQGTGAASPLVGTTVVTRGIVTAAYPTGGFNGYVLQTPGTGEIAADHDASDAVFVYSPSTVASVAVGDYVEVTGGVSEFNGLTELTVAAGRVTELTDDVPDVVPASVAYPATASAREALESMLLAPTGGFTVTDDYSTNQYAEIGLATGDTPLRTPTDVAAVGTSAYDAAVADNAARGVVLDDGASINFLGSAANKAIPLPYLTDLETGDGPGLTVGAAVAFTAPVILDFRNDLWKLQPTAQLEAGDALPATFSNARDVAPEEVGGALSIASFNVLNYFTTTGDELTGCTYFSDRAGDPVTVSGGCDARGAAEQEDLDRQQAKIVAAIEGLDASVLSLEEIENSIKFGDDRDAALAELVGALNASAGSEKWAYVPSPTALPDLAGQDVIRVAFIYQPALVAPVGESRILDVPAFANAREPLAQEFAPVDDADHPFLAVVNHFKSKGDSTPAATGDNANGPQGAFNGDRTRQAEALVDWVVDLETELGTESAFLLGDFNSYSHEDPVNVLADAGYVDLGATTGKFSYSFDGQSGSLDHAFATPAAAELVTGVDVWNINAGSSVALEYSRDNDNATDFYRADPYRASDHDPVLVGFDATPAPVRLDLLNINDFHGRIDANTVKFAGTVETLRAENPDGTLFLSAGDNIGASLFASSVAQDQPTIDVLNALDLQASSIGNHELDQGYDDLTGRVSDAADWDYLGANVYLAGTTTPALDEYALFEVDGLTVGVIGAVTEETPTLVSPNGITDLEFGDPVEAVDRVAAQLSDGDASNGEADVLIAEYHEGAPESDPATLEGQTAASPVFDAIVNDTSADVDAIFTGHTHQEYVYDAAVPGTDATRPVIQTGDYGDNVGHVTLTVDPSTGEVTAHEAELVARSTADDAALVAAYPRVAEVKTIVDAALAAAAVIGEQPVGSVTSDITTAFSGGSYVDGVYTGGTRDNRAAHSTLGNLVADSLVESLSPTERGGAEIGVVNPGGLRAELTYAPDGTITYAEANAVLPFVNNLWTTSLTGDQFKTVLEQQWQTNADGTVPTRPYLQLGLSSNVTYTYDPAAAQGSHITGIWIDGAPIDPAASYRIGSFNFLLTGGDNFREFTNGTDTRDSGLVDRDAWIAFLGAHPDLAPDFASRSAIVTGAPTDTVAQGDTVSFQVSGLNLTSLGSPLNTSVSASWTGSTAAPVIVPLADGVASVSLTVPQDAPVDAEIVLTADPSGTVVRVPVTTEDDSTGGGGHGGHCGHGGHGGHGHGGGHGGHGGHGGWGGSVHLPVWVGGLIDWIIGWFFGRR